MPSIFLWKASVPNPSKKNIRYYSGSSWVVEDNEYSSCSYQYLQQIVIPGSDGNSVITFLAKRMPHDWIGSELLEVRHVPYHHIRSDDYATYEHIGNWMRVTLKTERPEMEYTREHLQTEWNRIQQWISRPINVSRTQEAHRPMRKEYNKISRPTTKPPGPPIMVPSISVGTAHMIDPQQVRQSFQEFYAKFGTPPSPRNSHRPRAHPRPPRH